MTEGDMEAGTALLLAAAPAGKGCLIDAASALPPLAAVAPSALTGTAAATVIELADPAAPQTVLTRIRAAAATNGPLSLYITGQLHLDHKQRLMHLALARTTPKTLRYTGLPWHWLTSELKLRRPGTTTVVVDLVADADAWQLLGVEGLAVGYGTRLYGRVQPPPRRTVAAPAYVTAWAAIWRSGARPSLAHLHEQAAARAAVEGAVFLAVDASPPAVVPGYGAGAGHGAAPGFHEPAPAPYPGPAPHTGESAPAAGAEAFRAEDHERESPVPSPVPPAPMTGTPRSGASRTVTPRTGTPQDGAPVAGARTTEAPADEQPGHEPRPYEQPPHEPPAHEPGPDDPHPAILAAARAGRYTEAASIVALWESEAIRLHGPGSTEAVHWLEVRADLARLARDPARSCAWWMAAAEARLAAGQRPEDEDVVAAVDRAHHQWEQLREPTAAGSLAPALTELRRQVPGHREGALLAVQRRAESLRGDTA
ncbi:hypothetical protein [Streptomyces hebeiensis]